MAELTEILRAIDGGDAKASAELLPLVYDELRRLAASQLANRPGERSLQVTELVHEAYLRLLGPQQQDYKRWNSSGHYFVAAAEAIRRILIESHRRKQTLKRGGQFERINLENSQADFRNKFEDVLEVSEALEELEMRDPRAAKVVKLRYFAGLSIQESAEALGISMRTANREWAYAKAWLFQRLK